MTELNYKISPLISKEFINVLEQAFSNKIIKPTDNINDIMYNAGQQSVLNYINNYIERINEKSKL